jgi:hypothetical protein
MYCYYYYIYLIIIIQLLVIGMNLWIKKKSFNTHKKTGFYFIE